MEMNNILIDNYMSSAGGDISKDKVNFDADEAKKIETAKKFEAIFINELFKAVKKTIPDESFSGDSASRNMKDMFWSFLADEISDKGGFGMWKDIYQQMSQGSPNPAESGLDVNI